MLSLKETVESEFGKSLPRDQKEMLESDLKSIKQRYRRERGIWKSLRVTYEVILFGFKIYEIEDVRVNETRIEAWKQFVECFKEGGADFLELYIE